MSYIYCCSFYSWGHLIRAPKFKYICQPLDVVFYKRHGLQWFLQYKREIWRKLGNLKSVFSCDVFQTVDEVPTPPSPPPPSPHFSSVHLQNMKHNARVIGAASSIPLFSFCGIVTWPFSFVSPQWVVSAHRCAVQILSEGAAEWWEVCTYPSGSLRNFGTEVHVILVN